MSSAPGSPPPPGFDRARRGVPRGQLHRVEYRSRQHDSRRKMVVYAPPGHTAEEKLPVLYLLHGVGDNETGWWKMGKLDAILDNLYAVGGVERMLVAMPNGRASAPQHDGLTRLQAGAFHFRRYVTAIATGRGPNGSEPIVSARDVIQFADFEREFTEETLPFVEARFRVRKSRSDRAVAGLSMGGGQALNIGLANLDLFAWIAAMSPAPNVRALDQLVTAPPAVNRQLRLLYLSCGMEDKLVGKVSTRLHADLNRLGVAHTWHHQAGSHHWPVWRRDLYWIARRLFR